VYTVVLEKSEGKRPLGKPGRSWKDNIKRDLHEMGYGLRNGWSWLRAGTVGRYV
jgi:hypothetical protein